MLACSLAFLLPLLSCAADAPPPTLILHGGKVVTVDSEFRLAEALAVRGDRIIAVGTDREILPLAGPETRRLDLRGRTVIPGLIDSHTHPTGAAMFEFDHEIPPMETIDDVLKYIERRAAVLEEGKWIVLRQVFITRLRETRYPTREELDRAAPRHPVLFSTGPDASLNSLALRLSGIDRDFEVNDGGPGYIERDPETREPTGILRSCTRYVKTESEGRRATAEDRVSRLRDLFRDYNAVGITGISDRNAGDSAIELYQTLRDREELTCRVFVYASLDPQAPIEKLEARVRQLREHRLHPYNNQVWVRGVKVFLDGGMLTGSAYMRKPWGVSDIYSITDPEYRGLKFIEQGKLNAICRLVLENGLQMTAHSVGDGAVHSLLEAYAAVNEDLPVRELRPCITHCNFMSREAIEQMRELGVVADLQPAWLYLDGRTLTRQFGEERLTWFQPYRTIFERGVVVGGGSDHMQRIGSFRSVNPYNPFLGMWIALTRLPRGAEGPLHAEQQISREQALRLYTINNAYLSFEEKEKGSLEVGKLADFVILKHDLLTCPLEQVKDVEVAQTYLGGKLVYEAP